MVIPGRAVVVALVLVASAVHAQQRDSIQIPLPGPRVLHGFVADSNDAPIDSAEVFISSLKRAVFTASDGSFRFEDIKPGKYQVGARKVGYFPQGRTVQVGDNGGATAFRLGRRPGSVTLPAVVSSARRGGLSGVVGDTAYKAIADAKVWVLASDKRAQSDSTGAFFLDLKPGRHMVRVEREGYGSQFLSVTIPNDSGRRVMVWMSPASGSESYQSHMMQEFSMRLARRNPVWSRIYTREDITRSGRDLLRQLATDGAGRPVPDTCETFIDGDTTRKAPVWAIDAADIETLEVYAPKAARGGVKSIGSGSARGPSQMRPACPILYTWMRK